ncbi:MAG: transposase [Thermodesulfobacteriota bacterium]|nr:transposase [Thermodesulfobacteriota bacterium]
MTQKNIIEVLEDIQNKIKKTGDEKSKEILLVLYNLIEDIFSDNSKLKKENQTLKDEINNLKGEQGKPVIKPGRIEKDGNISSEDERKAAEISDSESKREAFKLGKPSLEKLKENRIPGEVLEKLKGLNGQKYANKDEFAKAVTSVIGSDLTNQYIQILVKYAKYKKRQRNPKIPEIHIDREEICFVDPDQLPEDAENKGFSKKVVQDIIIKTDNIKFMREVYYSASMNKTWLGEVPIGYEGGYGPNIKSHILSMKYVNNMSIPKINEFLRNCDILISGTYISNQLTKHIGIFHKEKSEIYQASLETSSYQQIDDTGCRVNGQNQYTQIVCNPLATIFFTTERKDRLTILDILRNFEYRSFLFNNETFSLLEKLKVSRKLAAGLDKVAKDTVFNEQEMDKILNNLFPDPDKGKILRIRIMEAAAIAYYHQEVGRPIVNVLLGDDAPQFKLITKELSLCWVHDGRHYKRLMPIVPNHQKELTTFLDSYWKFYHTLHEYKKNPSPEFASSISDEFDILFSTKTEYDELNKRISKTNAKKKELLIVLKHPELPLHNNLSENGARVQKRREDVSLQTITKEGTDAKDAMMTTVETSKKLSVNPFKYIFDRVSKKFEMPSLASLIRANLTSRPAVDNTS